MYLIYDYESDCSSTDSDQGEWGSREIRKVYLWTYFNRQIPHACRIEQKEIALCDACIARLVLFKNDSTDKF